MPTPGAALRIGDLTLLYQEHAKGYYTCHGQPTGEAVTIDCALRPLNRRSRNCRSTSSGRRVLNRSKRT